jgi:hypothetical protein
MARTKRHPSDLIEHTSDFAAPRYEWRAQYRAFARQHASSQPGDDARLMARADADVARTLGSR